jgi:hypothetical protein
MSSKPSQRSVILRAHKVSTCRVCGKSIVRRHTFYATTFDIAHTMRAAWLRVTNETCQEHTP